MRHIFLVINSNIAVHIPRAWISRFDYLPRRTLCKLAKEKEQSDDGSDRKVCFCVSLFFVVVVHLFLSGESLRKFMMVTKLQIPNHRELSHNCHDHSADLVRCCFCFDVIVIFWCHCFVVTLFPLFSGATSSSFWAVPQSSFCTIRSIRHSTRGFIRF